MPRLRVFAGPNGSGKSTLLNVLPPEWVGVYVNADDLERAIRTYGDFDLADYGLGEAVEARFARLSQVVRESERLNPEHASGLADQMTIRGSAVQLNGAQVDSYAAGAIADFLRSELLDAGEDFTFETVMSHPSKVDFMARAQQRGYRTYLYFIATEDVTINVDRVRQRVDLGGHPVDARTIDKRYPRSIALLRPACDVANRAYIFDNSGETYRLIAEVTNGEELEVHTDSIPAWFYATELWDSFQM